MFNLELSDLLRKGNARYVTAKAQQSFLQRNVARLWIAASLCSMKEIATADSRSAIVADREPRVCFVSLLEIIRRPMPAHFGWNPTRIDGIRVDI